MTGAAARDLPVDRPDRGNRLWPDTPAMAIHDERRRRLIKTATKAARPLFETPRLPLPVKRVLADVFTSVTKAPGGVCIDRDTVAGVPGRWVRPAGASAEHVLLYLHGGGYATGSSRGYAGYVGRLAHMLGMSAFIPDYRRAPEQPFPAGLDDVVVAFHGLIALGYKPAHIAVAGESAGAGLALAMTLLLRDAGEPMPAVLGLACAWLDLAADLAATRVDRKDPLASLEMGRLWASEYAGSLDPMLPGISPVHADLHGLPPLLIQSSSDDLFGPDSALLATRARIAGVRVEHREWSGMWHGFQLQAGMLADAEAALLELSAGLLLALRGTLP